ncbi:hypothetical protein EG68_08215 [Paragonimus skrjabini miyazakii]|uniref:DAAF9 N-terminal domain-containing protein n=1 Tax=Paragonimus skrjabini miyazakii TaxID=59628 RepID=A0A8S9YIW4_9TREM|nr:hypothetical protein EG68_08215 [Paragonimus skrjabini miyazakii]
MMPLALSRRPGQTRHDIPQFLFSPFLSLYRINSLRTLMRKDHCDCILIILGSLFGQLMRSLGLDSKFCDGAHQTASYLLFDIFESRESDILKSKVDMEVFEDVIICIKKNETHIYCNAVNYMLFLPYITSWPNLRIHCITEGEMNNVDSYEESKILAFKNITQNCKFIFLPYNDIHVNAGLFFSDSFLTTAEGNFNKMMIEDWPIVQSYAFDCKTQSSHEFFTLSREVVDISNDVGRLAKQMDPVYIEESLVRSLLAFTGTLEAVYRLMDSYTDSKTQSLKASPIEVGLISTVVVTLSTQPLLSIYQHATFAVKNSPRLLPPYLLYGKETSKFNILSADMKFKVTENVHSMEFDHAIIRGYAQPSGLVCERTLFFQQSHNTVELPLTTKPHFNRLTRIYTELLSVLWSVMDEWQKNTHVSLDKILLQVQSLLTHKLQCEQFKDLEIKSTYPWQNPTDPVTMVVLNGAVYDILDEDGTSLGSLVAADTWIISTLRVNQCELETDTTVSLTKS